jgi:hypothetical protein
MKNPRILATVGLIISLLLLVVTAVDFLALTDISHDYVSARVFESLRLPPPAGLPEWTATEGEWLAVSISVYSRLALLTVNTLALALCAKALRSSGFSAESRGRGGTRDFENA